MTSNKSAPFNSLTTGSAEGRHPTGTAACAAPNKPSNASSETSLVSTEFLQRLASTVQSLTPKDVGFDTRWISDSNVYAAPVAYVHIMENEIFSMGIFILRPGSRIPLHDHPSMYGVLRVIHGSLRCRSFSRQPDIKPSFANHAKSPFSPFSSSRWHSADLIVARPHQDVVLTPSSPTQVLTPTHGNFHEITPVDGPAVFLDILAPPYDHDLGTRECRFYKEVTLPQPSTPSSPDRSLTRSSTPTTDSAEALDRTQNHNFENGEDLEMPFIYLVETNQPKDYWCESAEYKGPSVI